MNNTSLVTAQIVLLATLLAGCQTTPAVPEYDGANLYRGYCASCHGVSGKGDGPVSGALSMDMPDLRTIAARNGGAFPQTMIDSIIEGRGRSVAHGAAGMPVWGRAFFAAESAMGETEPEKFAAARIKALSDYLEFIQIDVE